MIANQLKGWMKLVSDVQKLSWIRESNLIEGVNNPLEDTRCIYAWEWLQAQEFNLETILKLHKKIMHALDFPIAGKLRTINVGVGGRLCPHWALVSGLLTEWIKNSSKLNDVLTIKRAHITFEKIHPFSDGNGRTGRMLMNWMLVKNGHEPITIKCDERWEYYKWFEVWGK